MILKGANQTNNLPPGSVRHSDGASPNELANLLTVADYLSCRCNLGFFSEPAPPPRELLAACGLDDEAAIALLLEELAQAHRQESALFEK